MLSDFLTLQFFFVSKQKINGEIRSWNISKFSHAFPWFSMDLEDETFHILEKRFFCATPLLW
jgi:hypothetical protein